MRHEQNTRTETGGGCSRLSTGMTGTYYYYIVLLKCHGLRHLCYPFLVKQVVPQTESLFFLAPHLTGLIVAFVTLSKKVQHTVDYDTMQLVDKRYTEFFGILPHPLYTNHYVTRNQTSCHIVKSNNIGVSVMVKILPIDLQQVLIVTKEVVDVADLLITSFYHFGNPFLHFLCLRHRKISRLCSKTNRHILSIN